jgi:intraflagellar transport protein 80
VSSTYDYVITSVAWAPNGEYFAVGSFETIILCNKNGWTYNFSKVEAGSIMRMAWATDGTTVSAAGVILLFSFRVMDQLYLDS